MKPALLIVACIMAGAAHAQNNCRQPDPKAPWFVAQQDAMKETTWSNDSLRRALMSAVELGGKLEPQLGWELNVVNVKPLSHLEALDYLRKQAATRGSPWPNRSAVGAGGVRAVYHLAQRDTALLRVVLHRMMEGGPDEGIKADIAMIEDRVRLLSGRKQLYGTQLGLVNGRYAPLTIEDSAHVDLRREGADLPPLRWSVCNANVKR